MTKIAFLIEIEVERESGKFASRDEIAAAICETLTDAPDGAAMDSLGANGDSIYNVTHTDITELDKKALKELWKHNEERVLAELPGDAALRASNKRLKRLLDIISRKVDDMQKRLDDTRKVRDEGKTSIWYNHGHEDETKVYLPDGRYDRIRFAFPDEHGSGEYIDFGITELDEKRLVSVHGSRALALLPNSSNTLYVGMDRNR